ncbi:acetamidase [Candidatus Poribacteria bacterium]|nr:acetamidase [Candidatus Poribacteria bacterium]
MIFKPKKFYYTFGPHEPALILKPGDSLTTATLDSGSIDHQGNPADEDMLQTSPDMEFYTANPQVGPFYVEGAEIGDTLSLYIQEIKLNRDYASSKFPEGFGVLNIEDRITGPMGLGEPLPYKEFQWEIDTDKKTAFLDVPSSKIGKVEISLHPFLGCIGVSPKYGETINSLTPAEHGGNMDCVETKAGTTVYLPVFVRGGLFMFGDVHAAQGDGEICGVALETTAEVTIKIDVIKDKEIRWPRFEDDTHIMVAASTRPLIDAFRIAHTEMIKWLEQDYGYDRWDAYQLLSQVGTARVGNVVDPKYTVVSKFPREYLIH